MARFSVNALVLLFLYSLSSEFACNGDTQCSELDREALIDFKNGPQDPENRLSSWRGSNCCQWRGVLCDNSSGAVIAIDLHDPRPNDIYESPSKYGFWNLSGKIDPALLRLKSLRQLDLSLNTFPDIPIPEFLGSLKGLRYLNLSSAGFSGAIPPTLGNLSSLRYLSLILFLQGNNVEGEIPSSIGNLCNIKNLDLSDNNLDGRLPEFLDGTQNCFLGRPLPNLMLLELGDNRLVGNLPKWLGELKNLVELNLYDNLFQGPILASLGQLPLLEHLRLDRNELNGSLPHTLGQLSRLVFLDVSFNHLTGIVSETHFSKLINLIYLDMSDNSLILNVSSKWIPPFQVKYLYMGSCQLGPSFPVWLETQKKVKVLYIFNASISAPIPNWFWDLSSDLFALNASFNYLQGQLPNRLKFPVIKYIDFSSNLLQGSVPLSLRISFLNLANNRFSGPIPSNIGDVLPNLTILYLSSNQITGKIPVSIGKLQNLRILDLSRNNLTGSIPSSFGNIYSLYALDLRHNNLSGAIPWTLGQLTELIILHLSDNRLSGELPPSLQNCSSLESIDLGNNKISGNIPPWIGEQWFARGLRILRLRSNALSGRLPSQLSNLSSLQILDIAENNLVGSIPASIGNLEAMAHVQNDSTYLISTWWYRDLSSQRLYVLPIKQRGPFYYEGSFCYKESLVVPFKNQGREFTKTLFLVTCIDLSRNNLSGEFPAAIMNLSGLVILNLSGNHN